ncbi:MAG: hypothetical protein HQ515_05770 [Phycisphaeraceae bacterium]|nr:hypothetical protein [Phycisphaeraceae bacterium]
MPDKLTFDIIPVDRDPGRVTIKASNDSGLIEVDTLRIESRQQRAGLIRSLVAKTDITESELDRLLIQAIDKIKFNVNAKAETEEQGPLAGTTAHLRAEALALLENPDLFDMVADDIERIGIAGEKDLCRQLYIIMTSRVLDKPLAGIVFGASASGKSYMIERIADMMPPESVLQAHDITNEALYYLEEGSLEHKIVVAGERLEAKTGKKGKAEDNTKALREMLASGKLSKLVTVKDNGGTPTGKLIEQKGPIAYLESTTSTGIHDEDATRLLPLVTDESATQTSIIVDAMKRNAKGELSHANVQGIIEKHQTLQRMLEPLDVRIPFIDALRLPDSVVSTRRAYGQLVSMIKAVALLRQFQKPTQTQDDQEYIEADAVDYAIVYPLILKIFSRTYSPINQKSRDLLKIIQDHACGYFTINELVRWAGISDASIRRRLHDLVGRGIVEENKEKKPHTFKLINAELAEYADIDLAHPDDIAERVAIMSEGMGMALV